MSEKKWTSTVTPKVRKSTKELQDALFEDAATSSFTKKGKDSRKERDDSPLQVEKSKGGHEYQKWTDEQTKKLIEHIVDCQEKGVRLFLYNCKFNFYI